MQSLPLRAYLTKTLETCINDFRPYFSLTACWSHLGALIVIACMSRMQGVSSANEYLV